MLKFQLTNLHLFRTNTGARQIHSIPAKKTTPNFFSVKPKVLSDLSLKKPKIKTANLWYENKMNLLKVEQVKCIKNQIDFDKQKLNVLNFLYFFLTECIAKENLKAFAQKKSLDDVLEFHIQYLLGFNDFWGGWTILDPSEVAKRIFESLSLNIIINNLDQYYLSHEFKYFLMQSEAGKLSSHDILHFKRQGTSEFFNINCNYFLHYHHLTEVKCIEHMLTKITTPLNEPIVKKILASQELLKLGDADFQKKTTESERKKIIDIYQKLSQRSIEQTDETLLSELSTNKLKK